MSITTATKYWNTKYSKTTTGGRGKGEDYKHINAYMLEHLKSVV